MQFKKTMALLSCTALLGTQPVIAAHAAARGDLDGDGAVTAFDVAIAKKGLLRGFSSGDAEKAADINEDGKTEVSDMIQLLRFVMGQISQFEVTEPAAPPPSSADPTAYMQKIRESMTNNVPAEMTAQTAYGKVETISYYSKTAEKQKSANVLLPDGYSTSERYPVLYINHGIFGDHNSMLDEGMKVRSLAGNLANKGEAKKMIIVLTSMYTSKTSDQCSGFTLADTLAYDAFLDDLTGSLMPYIESNYAAATGRENTAITGFSMGGREALYIGVSRPDVFGYIGAACPAPGVTPGKDMFMDHPGSMTEQEFRIDTNLPYVFMITGGTNDGVVGTFPQSYHNILTTNGTDHIWQEIQGGGHDGSCVVPHLYNYMKAIFKAE